MNKKLNIAIIDMDDLKNPFWGAGQARATREEGKRLAKHHIVTVYCSKYPGYRDYTEDGVEYKHIGIVNGNPQITNAAFALLAPFTVMRIKADLILEYFNAPISVGFAPLFTKIPVIGFPSIFNAKEFSKKYHLPFHLIETFGVRFYKYFLPLGDDVAQRIAKINKKALIKTIPEGVDPHYFTLKRKNPKHVLFIGRFDINQKGIDLLVQAYSKIYQKAKYPLVIAGLGADEKKIRELVKKHNAEKFIKVTGPLWGEQKDKMLTESIYVAFPSRYETFSLFALESFASGLPIVAFDIPGIKWTGNTVALKAKPFNIDEYAKLLLKSMDENKMRLLGKRARKYARNFDWNNVVSEFEKFFYMVLEKETNNANRQ